jgi:tetratricopeptide (TPR) repeat protein
MLSYKPSARLNRFLLFALLLAFISFGAWVQAQTYTLEEGKRLTDEGEFDKAREVLLEVVKSQPQNPEVNFLLCRVFVTLGDHDNALKYGEKAVKLDDSASNYHLWLGRAQGLQAQNGSKIKAIFRANRAKGEFEKAVQLDSTNIDARLQLAQYLLVAPGIAGGDKREAKRQVEIVEQMDSLYGAFGWGYYWQAWDDTEKAEAAFRRAVRLDTTYNHQATYALGFFMQNQKRYHEAAGAFENGFRKYPDDTGLLYQVGRSYIFSQDSLDKAERCFKQYLQVEPKRGAPDWAAAHWRLGMVYELKGELQPALAEMQEAVKLSPENQDYQNRLKTIQRKIKEKK